MVDAPSFSQPYLCIQLPLQSPPTICSSTSVNFHLATLLVHKIILIIPTNTPFLYTSAVLHLLISACKHPSNLHQKYFSYVNHLANSGCVKGQGGLGSFVRIDAVYTLPSSSKYGQRLQGSQSLIPYCSGSKNWFVPGSSL